MKILENISIAKTPFSIKSKFITKYRLQNDDNIFYQVSYQVIFFFERQNYPLSNNAAIRLLSKVPIATYFLTIYIKLRVYFYYINSLDFSIILFYAVP